MLELLWMRFPRKSGVPPVTMTPGPLASKMSLREKMSRGLARFTMTLVMRQWLGPARQRKPRVLGGRRLQQFSTMRRWS